MSSFSYLLPKNRLVIKSVPDGFLTHFSQFAHCQEHGGLRADLFFLFPVNNLSTSLSGCKMIRENNTLIDDSHFWPDFVKSYLAIMFSKRMDAFICKTWPWESFMTFDSNTFFSSQQILRASYSHDSETVQCPEGLVLSDYRLYWLNIYEDALECTSC